MIRLLAVCSRCKVEATVEERIYLTNRPDGWGSLYQYREPFSEGVKRVDSLDLCPSCLADVMAFATSQLQRSSGVYDAIMESPLTATESQPIVDAVRRESVSGVSESGRDQFPPPTVS